MTLPWLCRLAGSPSSLQRPFHVVEVIAARAQKLAVRVLRSDGRPPPRKTRLPAAGPALSDASLWGQTDLEFSPLTLRDRKAERKRDRYDIDKMRRKAERKRDRNESGTGTILTRGTKAGRVRY